MRISVIAPVVFIVALGGTAAVLSARQQASPGMSQARFWINNRAREDAIPVNLVNVHPESPSVPVAVKGSALVDFTDRARAVLAAIHSEPQTVVLQRPSWEYREMKFGAADDRVTALNQAGALGWEVAGVTANAGDTSTILLKRPR